MNFNALATHGYLLLRSCSRPHTILNAPAPAIPWESDPITASCLTRSRSGNVVEGSQVQLFATTTGIRWPVCITTAHIGTSLHML